MNPNADDNLDQKPPDWVPAVVSVGTLGAAYGMASRGNFWPALILGLCGAVMLAGCLYSLNGK